MLILALLCGRRQGWRNEGGIVGNYFCRTGRDGGKEGGKERETRDEEVNAREGKSRKTVESREEVSYDGREGRWRLMEGGKGGEEQRREKTH